MKCHPMLCFGRFENSGNTAIVVEDFVSDGQARQQFATAQNAPATVYLDVESDGTVTLDYYYPHTRSPLCLHATLAAAALLFERTPGLADTHVVSAVHRQRLDIARHNDLILVGLKPQPCPLVAIDPETVAQLLNIASDDLLEVPALASVGSPKLLVRVADEAVLRALRPDLAGIVAWSKQHRVSGFYVYCALGDGVFAGRNFNHLSSNSEDAATGVAAGALALFLKQSIRLLQGDALGQPCTLTARYTADGADGAHTHETIYVGGSAHRP